MGQAPVFLLSDFGLSDSYVGIVRAVIAGIAPAAAVHDLGHDLPPHDIRAGAYALLSAAPYLPASSVVCAVIDPGVGSSRRALALRLALADRHFYLVAPDNGLVAPLLARAEASRIVELDEPAYHLSPVSATFHGRDVFAPAAAHLAAGTDLGRLGSRLEPAQLVRLDWPEAEPQGDAWQGEVLQVDRFGNLITNLAGELIDGEIAWQLQLSADSVVPVGITFSDAAHGEAIAYRGSGGLIEVAVRNGDAAGRFGIARGAGVRLIPLPQAK